MLDFIYQTGWGAFTVMLLFQIPFAIVFLYLVYRKAFVNPKPSGTEQKKIARTEGVWLTAVIVLFLVVNIASIQYMPTVTASQAAITDPDLQEVEVKAASWYFEISDQELELGRPVRFAAKSADTMHGFAVYHPDGRLLFTMMLLPGLEKPASVVHTFTETGTYKVRCLEYCGIAHHAMRSQFVVTQTNN